MQYICLDDCVIAISPSIHDFVGKAVEDLRLYLESLTGNSPEVTNHAAPQSHCVLLIGQDINREHTLQPEIRNLPEQGYILKTMQQPKRNCILAAGGGPHGDAYAIIELIKSIKYDGKTAYVEPLDVVTRPAFGKRGIYAHQHWAYNYPYALRSWKFEDWKKYIDLLAYMRINFFQIWSMSAICPTPLSEPDREYLENYRKVIDYAKNQRGMEVWIGECANNVAETDKGYAVADREYFEVEVLKNPADKEEFEPVLENRRMLYRIASNADGYWIIDSDPGGCKGSPAGEFVDILTWNRELIDQENRGAVLAYWMWQGWGNGTREENCTDVVKRMEERLDEPWRLLPCNETHLKIVKERGHLKRAIFFPYGIIEDEPSVPTTRDRFWEMAGRFALLKDYEGINGVMGNAQTPFVNLPNIFYFAESAWTGKPEEESVGVLNRLAEYISPDMAPRMAKGWLLLEELNVEDSRKVAEELESAVNNNPGRAGVLGQFLFPGHTLIAEDIVMQLKTHAIASELRKRMSADTEPKEIASCLYEYYASRLDWQKRHGYHGYFIYGPDAFAICREWPVYARDKEVKGILAGVREMLINNGYKPEYVDGIMVTTRHE